MQLCEGVWLPDGEKHLKPYLQGRHRRHAARVDGRGTYQFHKLTAALAHVRAWRTAVDVGAHVGLWSMHLARRFERVAAFEPVKEHRDCFLRNVTEGWVDLHPVALGERAGWVSLQRCTESSGDTRVRGGVSDLPQGGEVEMRTLDSLELGPVDFVKLDCEGFELFALKGGEATLRRCRPAVIVEQKPGKAQAYGLGETEAVSWLEGLGAVVREEIGGDFILSWPEEAGA